MVSAIAGRENIRGGRLTRLGKRWIRTRGRVRSAVYITLIILAGAVFLASGFVSEASDRTGDADNQNAIRTALQIIAGLPALVLLALVTNQVQRAFDRIPRHVDKRLQNHDVTKLAGKSISTLLLALKSDLLEHLKAFNDPTYTPSYILDNTYHTAMYAEPSLDELASVAERVWLSIATANDKKTKRQFRDLVAPRLSRFIRDPAAPVADLETWGGFLLRVEAEARKTFPTLDSQLHRDNAVREAVARMLEEQFGRAFREMLKADFRQGGLAWPAVQLSIASEILERVDNGPVPEELAEALDDLGRTIKEQNAALLDRVEGILRERRRNRAAIEELREEAKARDQRLAEQLDRLEAKLDQRAAPTLLLPTSDPHDEGGRFVYRNRRIDLVGREQELEELNRWLDDERPFSWDLWTGRAGTGKSRLALELCRQRDGVGWKAGFFDRAGSSGVHWPTWEPREPTLIVFDYVADHAEDIGETLRQLATREWRSDARVRCLLLEREIVRPDKDVASAFATAALLPPWIGDLLREGEKGGEPFRRTHARRDTKRPERVIRGVSREAVRDIIRLEAAQHGEQLDEATLDQRTDVAEGVDEALRPLFIVMTAEAIREHDGAYHLHSDGSEGDALVRYIREKEVGRWRSRFVDSNIDPAPWERLAALATMTDGLDGERLERALADADPQLALPSAPEWGDGSIYRNMISGSGTDNAAKLEPDLIGEAFVLSKIAAEPILARTLIDMAWSLGMDEFVVRVAQNFPGASELDELLRPSTSANAGALEAAHTALAVRDQRRGSMADVRARGRRLVLDESQPAPVRALGFFMWSQEGGDTPSSLDVFEAVRGLHPGDDAVREPLAKGLFNAFNGAPGTGLDAGALLDELRHLARDHPGDDAVREALAKGLVNALFGAPGNGLDAGALLDELRHLARDHPGDDAVRLEFAKGLFNAFNDAPGNGLEAGALLDELKTLADKHPMIGAVQYLAFLGYVMRFIAHLEGGTVDVDVVEPAVDLVPRLPDTRPEDFPTTLPSPKQLTLDFVTNVARASDVCHDDQRPALETAGQRLWAAYKARFDGENTTG